MTYNVFGGTLSLTQSVSLLARAFRLGCQSFVAYYNYVPYFCQLWSSRALSFATLQPRWLSFWHQIRFASYAWYLGNFHNNLRFSPAVHALASCDYLHARQWPLPVVGYLPERYHCCTVSCFRRVAITGNWRRRYFTMGKIYHLKHPIRIADATKFLCVKMSATKL